MNGIYVLKTSDGYRVAYSEQYDYLYGNFNDDMIRYDVDPEYLMKIFGNSELIMNKLTAEEVAIELSNKMQETDNGIMFIRDYSNYTFEELLNGKANTQGES
jgi:hypothetical protein